MNSHQVTKDSTPSLFNRNDEGSSTQGNKIHPYYLITKENQPESEVCLQPPSSKHAVSPYIYDPTTQGTVRVILHILRVPHLLKIGGGIPNLGR